MLRRSTCVGILLTLSAPWAGATEPPWLWTTQQRLAARFDPVRIAERRAEALAKQDEPGPVPAPGFAVINGARNPELLLPWEIFQHLLSQGFNSPALLQEDFRRRVEARAPGAELPVNFWHRLQLAGGDFLTAAAARRALLAELGRATDERQRSSISERIEAASDGYCQKRVSALDRARLVFGPEWFDRFLYLAVAPDMGLIWREGDSLAEGLLQAEGGCR